MISLQKLIPGALGTALLFGLTLSPVAVGATSNGTIVATIQTPPLKELSDNIMGLARAVQPGQQTEMMPLLFLGAFGYPEFSGVSRTDDVSLFVFEGDEAQPMPFVILAKIDQSSSLRQTLPMVNWFIREHGDWLLISNDISSFDQVNDIEPLVELNRRPRPFVVTLRSTLEPDTLDSLAATLKESLRQRHLDAAEGQAPEIDIISKTRFVDFALDLLKNIRELDTGLDISAAGLGLGMRVEARDGTPEAALLSARPAGPVAVGRYINASYPLIYLSSLDPSPLMAYTGSFFERSRSYAGDVGGELLGEIESLMLKWLRHTDGTAAGAMRLSGDNPEAMSVVGGDISEADFSALMSRFYNDLMPRLLEMLPYLQNRYVGPAFDYSGSTGEVQGIPLHQLTVRMESARPGGLPAVPGADSETESYLAVVDGNVLSANSRADITRLIQAVSGNQSADPSVASVLSLANNEVFRFNMDLKPLATQGLAAAGEIAGPALAENIRQRLERLQLDPLTGAATLHQGAFKLTTLLPASSLATLSRTYQEIQMEMMQQR